MDRIRILLLIGCIFVLHNSYAIDSNRRHIVILQDNSGSFFNYQNRDKIPQFQADIANLFDGKQINNEFNLLNKEIEQGISFFNPKTDNISFYWFVANQQGNIYFRDQTDGKYKDFVNYFFQKSTSYNYKNSGLQPTEFISQNFENRPLSTNTDFGLYHKGLASYSLSSFAFPLCLEIMNAEYSQEYIFIIISDFKAGSTFGNKQDEKIFVDAFKNRSTDVLNRINFLNSNFFKISYFDYYVNTMYDNMIGLTAFKIKPNAGSKLPENIEIRINSNIILTQTDYLKDDFELDETEIIFTHNDKIVVDSIFMSVYDSGYQVYEKNISSFVKYDKLSMTYHIDKIPNINFRNEIGIDSSVDGTIKFDLYTSYKPDEAVSIKYIYDIERSIDSSNFILQTRLTTSEIIFMIALILLCIITIIAIFLYRLGKPNGLLLSKHNFVDSYETTDFSVNGLGRVHTDYRTWTDEDEKRNGFTIKVKGRLDYRQHGKFYNWKEQTGFDVSIRPVELTVPNGFDAYVKWGVKNSNDPQYSIEIDSAFENNCFSFDIVFVRTNTTKRVDTPQLFGFKVATRCLNTGIRSFEVCKELFYSFHVGEELGNVWLGIDPGTTGSCIAIATHAADLTIEKDNDGKDRISPSVVLINSDNVNYQDDDLIRDATSYGPKAAAVQETAKRKKFVSIKKLLGYNEDFIIKSEPKITVSSSLLSTLLIEGLLNQHKEHIERNSIEFPQFFTTIGEYAPQRAAIAIPNNFTASKIQQLKECMLKVKGITLKEIRFVYEAEAILVNYINSPSANVTAQMSSQGENIFIYDMGGATINATLVNVKRKINNTGDCVYEIFITSKLGYGIGGDTIDYALLKWIFSKKDDYTILAQNDPFIGAVSNADTMMFRRKMKDEILKLKVNIIRNYNDSNSTSLIDRMDITSFGKFNLTPIKDDDDGLSNDPFYNECQKNDNSFLYSDIFKEFVWDNTQSIVNDIMSICRTKNINQLDTVIMSGRSSHFPRIKEVVEKTIGDSGLKPCIMLLELEESKSAVAKGACFYGTQKDKIILQNMTSSGVFGIVQTMAPNQPSNFTTLVYDGEVFNAEGFVTGQAVINTERAFSWDGNKVRFCQVMGVNPEEIIANNEKHKYSDVAILPAKPHAIKSVEIKISNKDQLVCSTTNVEEYVASTQATVCDTDIMTSNDEQYTFFVKQS